MEQQKKKKYCYDIIKIHGAFQFWPVSSASET